MKLKFYSLISVCLLNILFLQNNVDSKTIQVETKSSAKITIVQGQVKILENKKWITLSKNKIVKNNDRLKTYKNSRTELTFSDGSRLRLEENTDIILIKAKESENSFFRIFSGRLWANIINKGKNRVAIQSSTAALAVMGTTFDVEAEKNKTELEVFSGSVGVQLPSTNMENLDKNLKALKLEVDDNRMKGNVNRPDVISKPVTEIEKPVKVIPGPYEVSRDKWLEIVENQKITINGDAVGTVSELTKEETDGSEWVQWNKKLDSNTSEKVLFNR